MANPGAGAASSSLLVLLLVAAFAGDNRTVSFFLHAHSHKSHLAVQLP
jgi:hypothetical protein